MAQKSVQAESARRPFEPQGEAEQRLKQGPYQQDTVQRTDATSGLENTTSQDNSVQSYQALNMPSAGDHQSLNDEISQLAYQYYLHRAAGGGGSAEEDWLRAEREVLTRRTHQPQFVRE
ncbi:MAG: DUF2934 domain-containing protein [Bryobacteraceae bacterium]|nr:DUF2934 domain-containing protein [Bryobacteraceae bacterium]